MHGLAFPIMAIGKHNIHIANGRLADNIQLLLSNNKLITPLCKMNYAICMIHFA
jgi:hypothetical protein